MFEICVKFIREREHKLFFNMRFSWKGKFQLRLFCFHAFLLVLACILLCEICSRQKCNPKFRRLFPETLNGKGKLTIAEKNKKRLGEVQKFLKYFHSPFNSTTATTNSGNENFQIVISVIAVARKYLTHHKWNYLTQSVGTLLRELTNFEVKSKENPSKVVPFLCNVDMNPKNFSEANALKRYLKVVERHATEPHPKPDYEEKNIFDKEKEDYAFCLEVSLRLWPFAKYVLLLEDDALIKSGFFKDLNTLVAQLEFLKKRNLGAKFGYVKLYHPTKWRKLPLLVHSSCYSAILSFSIIYLSTFIFQKNPFVTTGFIFQFLLWILFFYILGQEILANARKGLLQGNLYLTAAESCCTPLVLFFGETAHQVLNILKSSNSDQNLAKDHILDELPRTLGLKGLQTDTNFVIHIGQFSTLRKTIVEVDG